MDMNNTIQTIPNRYPYAVTLLTGIKLKLDKDFKITETSIIIHASVYQRADVSLLFNEYTLRNRQKDNATIVITDRKCIEVK